MSDSKYTKKQKNDITLSVLSEKREDKFYDEPVGYYEDHGLWSPDESEASKLTEELFKKLEGIYYASDNG